MLSISIVAEELFKIGPVPVTNSILTAWIGVAVVSTMAFFAFRGGNLVPKGLQLIFESIYEFFLNLCNSVLENKKRAELAVPFIATIFLFVFVSNLSGLIPGAGSVGILKKEPLKEIESQGNIAPQHEGELFDFNPAPFSENTEPLPEIQPLDQSAPSKEKHAAEKLIPVLRAPSADLNMTLALALISVIVVQIVGFKTLGFSYLTKFVNLSSPINFFVGILELISEFGKVISFSFRLFGNIFAGEVLLSVMLMLVPYFVPIPFYGLELFVAVVQAFVFAMLTLVFIKLATLSHGEEGH